MQVAMDTVQLDADCIRPDVRLSVSEQLQCSHYKDEEASINAAYLYPPGFSNISSLWFMCSPCHLSIHHLSSHPAVFSRGDAQSDAKISTNIVPMYEEFKNGLLLAVISKKIAMYLCTLPSAVLVSIFFLFIFPCSCLATYYRVSEGICHQVWSDPCHNWTSL